jgi:hypothetical protein
MTACAPHHLASIVRRKDRPADMVGPDKEQLPAFDHADNLPRRPDILAQRRRDPRRRVEQEFGDPLARRVVHGMDLLARKQKPPHHLLARGAVRRISSP